MTTPASKPAPTAFEFAKEKALSEGRLKVLLEKAEENRKLWMRAENAEAELEALKATSAPVPAPAPGVMVRAAVAVTVFSERDGLYVLTVTNQKRGGFSIPGGAVEQVDLDTIFTGDDVPFYHAARRELLEETGIPAHNLRFIAGRTVMSGGAPWYTAGFIAEANGVEAEAREPNTMVCYRAIPEVTDHGLYREWYGWWFDLLSKLGEIKNRKAPR